jgi:hypothetical protein
VNKAVREHYVNPQNFRDYHALLDTVTLESFVRTPVDFDEAAFFYIDELGGFTNKPRFIVKAKHGNEFVIGPAALIGEPTREGDETDCPWAVEDVLKFIAFEPVAQGFFQ